MSKVGFLCLALALLCALLFVADLRGYFSTVSNPIATLTQSHGVVRHLQKLEMSWDRVRSGRLLGSEDTISTGEQSTARIQFKLGGELDLAPNSMVTLRESTNEVKLQFITGGGRIHVRPEFKDRIRISKGTLGQERKLASSPDIEVIVDEKASAPLDLSQQGVSQVNPKSETEIRNQEAALRQDELDRMALLPGAPELLEPAPQAEIEQNTVQLKWKGPEELASQAEAFELLLKSEEDEGNIKVFPSRDSHHVLQNLKPGRYAWSVRAIAKNNYKSSVPEFRSFEVRGQIELRQDNYFIYPVEVQ